MWLRYKDHTFTTYLKFLPSAKLWRSQQAKPYKCSLKKEGSNGRYVLKQFNRRCSALAFAIGAGPVVFFGF